ncbi:hypothetical protein ACRALDRAFT_2033803 [Sodiomyces alcalophilus JCM 7366]|uniref:uncharacterized protein n=1 Tax=Sodiomyces alcalophilus JCM 7366 TaxID=591952 RepID=UPI0039B57138
MARGTEPKESKEITNRSAGDSLSVDRELVIRRPQKNLAYIFIWFVGTKRARGPPVEEVKRGEELDINKGEDSGNYKKNNPSWERSSPHETA